MTRKLLAKGLVAGTLAALILPATSLADLVKEDGTAAPFAQSAQLNTLWVVVAALLVFFMQAGFAFLEIGFSRGKNAGTVVAKILTNFSIASLGFWAVGFAFAFGNGDIIGDSGGFFLRDFNPTLDPQAAFGVMGFSSATIDSKFFFQFVFCAVSLAIVWGTTLERIKFGVYVLYGIVFSTLIYPIAAHWVFGGGFLQQGDWLGTGIVGIQDFAGSTAVHLIGATGALAALLHLGPRRGKYTVEGEPRAIPGHNMPLFGLGVLILWLGWFGFNPGSTLGTGDGRFAEIVIVTNLAAASGVLMALITAKWKTGSIDIGMAGNGAIAGLVAITAPSGYVEPWTAPIIGGIAGIIVVLGVYWVDKRIDDPVGALSAHGMAGIWGTIACGIFTAPRLAKYNAIGDPEGGLIYSGSFKQLIAQVVGFTITFTFVFVFSWLVFWVIKKTFGMRVSAEDEDAGLDITEHGMYGYPEQFIPAPELVGYGGGPYKAVPPSTVATLGGDVMKLVMAYVRHEAFEPIRTELLTLGFPSLSISEVKGSGRQKGITERYRGAELTNYLRPKIKIECVVSDSDAQTIVDTILKHGRTGAVGDGKVFVLPVEESYRVRTGESGEEVLQSHPGATVE